MESPSPGNYVSFSGDHPGVDDNMATDIKIPAEYRCTYTFNNWDLE